MGLFCKKTFSVIIFIINLIFVSCSELDNFVADIENELKSAEKYVARTDNSDLYFESTSGTPTSFGVFDYIVVGAGSAGAIIAKRLSERKFKTLLLEAGDVPSNITDYAGLWKVWQYNSDLNWGYISKPQEHLCQGMINKQCKCPRGKALGGTSTINGIVYARGNSFDQNHWSDFGITGWTWAETLPFFKKLENYENIYGDPGYHGNAGPIYLDYARPSHMLANSFLDANDECYRVTPDYNGELQMGAGKLQFNKRFGRRLSTYRAFLTDYNPLHLNIQTKAFAHKIVFEGNRAVGVDFSKDNSISYRATARYEVIISSGAINSPQLLMLSGVGPKEELAKHGIPVIADLPVGKNLEDHVAFFGYQLESNIVLTDKNKPLKQHALEAMSETGDLTDPGGHALAFLATDGNTTYPDIELLLIHNGRPTIPINNEYSWTAETGTPFIVSDERLDNVFYIIAMLLHSKSRGTVTLQSKNPKDFPLIDSKGLSVEEDVERIYKTTGYIKKLLNTNAFKAIDAKLNKIVLPPCKDFEYDSKDYWYCTIRQLSLPFYHPTGTCRMGTMGSSVVDNKLRVHGIKGLRVADNSIVPRTNSGHINALAMMIGEKAAFHIIRGS